MTFPQAMEVAHAPQSRFAFGSPCRFIPRCDFTFHLLIPSLLRKGDTDPTQHLGSRASVA
jgi:hypothetical protein